MIIECLLSLNIICRPHSKIWSKYSTYVEWTCKWIIQHAIMMDEWTTNNFKHGGPSTFSFSFPYCCLVIYIIFALQQLITWKIIVSTIVHLHLSFLLFSFLQFFFSFLPMLIPVAFWLTLFVFNLALNYIPERLGSSSRLSASL